jgi:hypothetical protein
MKTYHPANPVRRDLADPRSTGAPPAQQPRKPFLNDRRSGR